MVMKKAFRFFLSFIIVASLLPCVTLGAEVCLFSASFENGVALSIVREGGGNIERVSEGGSYCLKYTVSDGIVCNQTYADISCAKAESTSEFVLEARIKIARLDEGAKIYLFDARKDSAHWILGNMVINDGGSLKLCVQHDKKTLCTVPENTWFLYSAAYNTESRLCKVYIDGVLQSAYTMQSLTGAPLYRIDTANTQGRGGAEFYIDDCKIYTGSQPAENLTLWENYSVMDFSSEAETALSGTLAFAVEGNYYFKDGQRIRYGVNEKPFMLNNIPYFTKELVKKVWGTDRDDVISANAQADNLRMNYLYDDRGFVILSNGVFPYVNSPKLENMFEMSDLIYRYLQFDNPTGEEMLADASNGRAHPRILYTADDIEYIGEKIASDREFSLAAKKAESSADKALGCWMSASCADSSKQSMANTFQAAMEQLACGYAVTRNSKYAEKAVEYMDALAGWDTLALSTSALITGHWAMGMAIGYDMFCDYMLENGHTDVMNKIKNAAKNLAFSDTYTAYHGEGGARWITITDNFIGVVGGGMLSLALALADEEDLHEDIEYLMPNLIKSCEIAVSLYYPDGGYFEGVGYSDYLLKNLIYAIQGLYNLCGTDYGLSSAKGFREAGSFFPYMHSSDTLFNFHDSDIGGRKTSLPYRFAYLFGDVEGAQLWRKICEGRGDTLTLDELMYFTRAEEMYGKGKEMSPDKYYKASQSGTFRNTFDGKNQVFAGFHAGRTGITHDSLDGGEFVFASNGCTWAVDLGRDDYSLPDYFGAQGYKLYRKRTEGENCLVFNPDSDASYNGQAVNADASLLNFTSKKKGAYAVYDLTDLYKRDVTVYKRGYYFGDDRSTLTIQDEFTVKALSEVYWFMHTPADIELNGNRAILTINGKKCIAEVLSDKNAVFCVMEPTQLDSSIRNANENPNNGFKKLAVHLENVTGDTYISVKLTPVSNFCSPSEHRYIPLSQWSVSDGTLTEKTAVDNAALTHDGFLTAEVMMPHDAENGEVYLNGVKEYEFENTGKGVYEITYLPKNLNCGTNFLEIESSLGGNKKRSKICAFKVFDEKKEIYSHNLKYWGGTGSTQGGFTLTKTGIGLGDSEGFSLTYSGRETCIAGTAQSDSIIKGETVTVQCDLKLSSKNGRFSFECKNSQGVFYAHDKHVFENGYIFNSGEYEKERWYHASICVDTAKKTYSIYLDGKPIVKDEYDVNAGSLMNVKLVYDKGYSGDKVFFRNFSIEQTDKTIAALYPICELSDNNFTVSIISENGATLSEQGWLITAGYSSDGKSLENIQIVKSDNISELSSSLNLGEEIKRVKVMLLNSQLSLLSGKWKYIKFK